MQRVADIALNDSADFKESRKKNPDILKKSQYVSLSPLEVAIRSQKVDIIFIILQAIEDQAKIDNREFDQDYFSLYCTEVTLAWLWMSLGKFEKFQQLYFSHAIEASNVISNPVNLNACPQADDHLYKGVTVLWWIVALACREMENNTSKAAPLCELVIDIFKRHRIKNLNLAAKPEHNEHPYIGVTVFWWIAKLTCHAVERNSQQANGFCSLMSEIYNHYSLSPKEDVSYFLNASPLNEHHVYAGMTVFWILTFSTWMAIKNQNDKNTVVLSGLIRNICQKFAGTLNFDVGLSPINTVYRVTMMFWCLLRSICRLTDGLKEQEDKRKVWMDSIQKIYHHQREHLDFTIEMLDKDEPSIPNMFTSLNLWHIIHSHSVSSQTHDDREFWATSWPGFLEEENKWEESWPDFLEEENKWEEENKKAARLKPVQQSWEGEMPYLSLGPSFSAYSDKAAAASSESRKRQRSEPWCGIFSSPEHVPQVPGEREAKDGEPPFKRRRTGEASQEDRHQDRAGFNQP
jgi:hypothetical protein